MPAYKDKAKGTWYASFYYEDWTGKKVKKMKRGFPTKREALEWERTFLQQQTADLEMTFENFVAVYVADMKGRIKENTWGTKEHILYKKLVPYFGKRKMCDIHSKEVIAWQNEMLGYRDKNGKPYSPVYLKTLHNQLSAVFNHAVRHYNLKVNPAAQAGNMGKPKGREMLFWTKAEYLKFAEAMMDKPLSYYAFEMLYWCGVREGELLALTPGDFDFEKQTVTISKSYQRIKGKDVIPWSWSATGLSGRTKAPTTSTCLCWTTRKSSGQRRSPFWRRSRRRKKTRWRARNGGSKNLPRR